MSRFAATVRDAAGARRVVVREAGSAAEARAGLRAEGMLVLDVEEPRGEGLSFGPGWLLPMSGFDVEMGLRQMASMLRSGVSVVLALSTTAEQARRPRAARAWRRVCDRVLAGESLADAMAAQGRFGEMTVRLARVGEQSGELDVALARAADQLEARRGLRALVVNALVYPVLAILMAVGVSAFLVVSVIPKISAFLQASGAELPELTRALVDSSAWLVAHGRAILLSVAGAVGLWLAARATRAGRELEDALLLRLPVAGGILRLSGTAVLARAMQTMVSSGVSLLDALGVAALLLSNNRLRRRVERVRDEVERGSSLAAPLSAAPEFMPMLGRMAAVGETTGSLAETFGETARFHESMLAAAVKRLSALMEPVMICVTGAIVGFVYVAFFMAIFALAGAG